MHRYSNYLSKLESMELQTIFKLFYVLQVNLDIFLQKKQNGTGYLCIQANFLVGKKKTNRNFPKILYRLLSSMPQKLRGYVYKRNICNVIVQLVISWDSFGFWYVRYHGVDGANFLPQPYSAYI